MKTIRPLSENPGKQEEIDFLQTVRASLPTGSYLASFLSEQMVAEVEHRIHDDWSCDVYETLQYETGKAGELRSELSTIHAGWDANVAKLETQLDMVRSTVDMALARVAQLESDCEFLRGERKTADTKNYDLECEAEHLKLVISRVKAMAFQLWLKGTPIDLDELRDTLKEV